EGQRLLPHRSASGPEPAVRLVTFVHEHDQRELRAAEARELEARVLAGVVERLHAEDGIRYGDIAVLLRAFTEVKTYENALRRRELPYYVVKGRGFFQCQEVSDVVSLLAAILDPEDAVALAAALRSPLFALDDDTLWRLARPPDADRPSLPRRFRAAEGFADLPEQAAALGAVRDLLLAPREPEAALVAEQDDVVRLMTIHQAKGLEFRAVVVPDLGRGPKADNRMPALDDALGVVGGPIDASGRVVTGHLGLEEHRQKEL